MMTGEVKEKRLIVVDLQYMFHRHKYRIKDFEEKKGTYMLSYNGQETARLYFTLKDFYSILDLAAQSGAELVVCMDSKSARKEESDDYKANRVGLANLDLEALKNIEHVLRNSGLAILKEDGYEADDLVAAVVRNRASQYNRVDIFTPDADLCALVKEPVRIYRYKSVYSKNNTFLNAHKLLTEINLSQTLSAEYKSYVPYNAVVLYKCTVGDASDGIKGIQGFGPAAFKKFVINLEAQGVDFTTLTSPENVAELLNKCRATLGDSAVEQALAALELVKSRTNDNIEAMSKNSDFTNVSVDKFREACREFGIVSF